jgi:uncharacterized protein (DUF362 family)
VPVIFDEIHKYKADRIRASVNQAIGKLPVDFKGKRSAFIKVNIVRPAGPESCIVTHPAVVEGLIQSLREHGVGDITIAEGSAAGVDTECAFRKSGYQALADRMRVRLLDLNSESTKRCARPWDYGTLDLPVAAVQSDLYINVPKMKTHFHTGVTLSIKNQQGLLTPAAKKATHREYDLDPGLVSIAKTIRPHLVVVDGIDAMEGEGPTKGVKKHTGVLVYGDDMLETDIACCAFMGLSGLTIRHLKCAAEQGLGRVEPEIIGAAFASLRTSFVMPSPKPKQLLNFYSWKNYRACAEDEHSFEEAIHLAMVTPRYWFTFFPKFLYFAALGRFHLLRGKSARFPDAPGRVLCIGDCCRKVAEERGTSFVPGCPPKPEDIVETIRRMK